MANNQDDHVQVSIRNYLQRTERDIGNIHQAIEDFLEYLKQCGLVIVREKKEGEKE